VTRQQPTSDFYVRANQDPGEEDGGADVGGAGGVGVSADDDPNDDVVENGKGEKLDQDILRKYLIYARTHCNPQVDDFLVWCAQSACMSSPFSKLCSTFCL